MTASQFPVLFAFVLLAGSPLRVSAYEPPEDLYRYLATVRRVIDGNTISADVDLGFGVWMHKTEIRLKGIETPKIEGDTLKEGAEAFKFLKDTLAGKERILIQTFYDPTGEYDGWYANVSIWDEDQSTWISVNQLVVDTGHGVATE